MMRKEHGGNIIQVLEKKFPVGKPITGTDKNTYIGMKYVVGLRAAVVTIAIWTVYNIDVVDTTVRHLYYWMLNQWIYNSVYFETWFATFCYTVIIIVYPRLVDKYPSLHKYKIHPSVKYVSNPPDVIMKEAVFYMTPLMLLDTFMVKQYHGVDPDIWTQKRASVIQHTRALPIEAPSTCAIVGQLVASFVLFDVIFFIIHILLHKNSYLYKYIHKHHHEHSSVHAHVTNQLTVIERVTLVLSANFALKVFKSHPLTRTIFVPLFVGLLVDNHAGYDMPFSPHRLVPAGIVGGALSHYQHHTSGKRFYQPIFTYLDKAWERFTNNNIYN